MTVATVEVFYALLALVAFAVIAGLAVVRIAARGTSAAQVMLERIEATFRPSALALAWLVALLATFGSLYFSEVAQFEPCRLCWYQRIAMYPMVVLLGIAAWRRDRAIVPYARALAAIGAAIALYQVALESIPALDTGFCGIGPSCSVVWFRQFGFVTLPVLALSAFLLILTLLAIGPGRGGATERIVDDTGATA